jgi:branched-chain amino acid transport system substrate-binding protein
MNDHWDRKEGVMKTKSAKIGIGSVCVLLTVILLAGIPFGAIAADTVKIGIVEPRSGAFEPLGRTYVLAAQFAVDEQNAKGGLLGKKIELFVEDSELKPDVATRKLKKLILEDKIQLTGHGSSSGTGLAMSQVCKNYKVIMVGTGTMATALTGSEFNRYFFRTTNQLYNLNVAFALLARSSPCRRIFIVGADFVTGRDAAKGFREQMKIHCPDAEIVGEIFHPLGTKDFAPYVTQVIAAKADMIMACSMGADTVNLVKQSRLLGLKKIAFLSHVFADPYLMKDLGDDGIGSYWPLPYSMRVNTPENQELIRRYHERHKNDSDFYNWWPFPLCGQAILGWKMAFAAVEKAGSLDPEKIIETFEGFQWKSPVGLWTMRKCDHQNLMPMFGGKMEGGTNPYYNGSIRPDVKFPWTGPDIVTFPAEMVAMPADTPGYNPRCRP